LELDAPLATKTNLFIQGLVVTVPNPKSLIFIAAFLPQFINATHPLGLQFAIIVPTFLLITFVVTSIWALAAGSARGFMRSSQMTRPVLRAAGGFMVIAGFGLALARRNS
jgi:threonine/homoserine/homoserine lactone efflux protein